MYRGAKLIGVLGAVGAVAACTVTPPREPTVMAVPPTGKSLAVFQRDDAQCRDYASASIGYPQSAQAGAQTPGGPNSAATSSYDLQTRYDIAYTQCMYSLGDTVRNQPPAGYAWYGYPGPGYPAGYPWYGWGGPGFFGTGFFAFRDHDRFFHHGFHDGFHGGFHDGFHGGFHGGGHGRG
jgi:hypothetical protein